MAVQPTVLKALTHLSDRPAINIEFQDLTYSILLGRKGSKVLLKNINGNFKAGQLTAILGPSGAGKSTLLNVLAGFKCAGTTGLISINGSPRDMKQFRRASRYIMQEDIHQPFLTVEECMIIAADFKLSLELSKEDKLTAVREILDILNLLKHKNTRTQQLSGGERKRLSIALELVNNPPVIFLDEPTTGLDDTASLQCTSLLKVLAQGGRNVICSIHTPSAKVFALFDNVYILSEGQCVYQGIGSDIVPFLSTIGLQCPLHYNPADFMVDVASGEYGCYMDELLTFSNINKKSNKISGPVESLISDTPSVEINLQPYGITYLNSGTPEYDCSTWKQFKLILYRMYLQRIRDALTMVMPVLMYVFLAGTHALIFQNVGSNATMLFSQFCLFYNTVMIHMYCPLFESVINFPMQLHLIKREHFNRWYNLKAYFWARTVFTIPSQIIYSCIFAAVIFGPTGLPIEMERMAKFVLICVLVAQISETIGLCISTKTNIVNGLFFAQVMICPLMMLASYGIGLNEIPTPVLIIIRTNYLRYSVEGLINAVFENRKKILCPESTEFCLYTYTKDILKFYHIENTNYWIDVAVLLIYFIFTKGLCLLMLRQRLSPSKTVVIS